MTVEIPVTLVTAMVLSLSADETANTNEITEKKPVDENPSKKSKTF